MTLDGAKEAQEFRVAWSIDAGRTQDDEFAGAVLADLVFSGEFAAAIRGDGLRGVAFAGGRVRNGGAEGGKTGNVDEPFDAGTGAVYGVQEISRSLLVNLKEFRIAPSLGCAGTMDDVGDASEGVGQTVGVSYRTRKEVDIGPSPRSFLAGRGR
jgi:hypothetical protein